MKTNLQIRHLLPLHDDSGLKHWLEAFISQFLLAFVLSQFWPSPGGHWVLTGQRTDCHFGKCVLAFEKSSVLVSYEIVLSYERFWHVVLLILGF